MCLVYNLERVVKLEASFLGRLLSWLLCFPWQRKKYRLEEGEPLTLLDLGGIFVLSSKVSLVPKLVGELERIREEAGLGVEDLLEGLDGKRRELYRERYGR